MSAAQIRAPFWQRDRAVAFVQPARLDPVTAEQRTGARCRTCGEPAHLPPIAPDMVLALTAKRFAVDPLELVSPRRAERLVIARAFAVWVLRSLGRPLSYPKIGRALGGRDHATIIHLHQKAIWLRLSDPFFRARCETLAERFYQLREHD